MAALILLVDADDIARQRAEARLSEIGYLVAPASTFSGARELLDSVLPDLVIVAAQVGAFSGLHLAARSRLDHPKRPVIITHTEADVFLQAEALRLGARFVVNPLQNPGFLRSVRSALEEHRHHQPTIRRWPRKQVAGTVTAHTVAAHARIHDMSYGGMRLAFNGQLDLPDDDFDILLPAAGLTVKAHRVWTSRADATDEFWCGAKVTEPGARGGRNWRSFVDSL